jgi:hypothetical protein
MTGLVQAGAVSGAVLAMAGLAALAWKGFIAAVEGAIGTRIDRVVQHQYEQDSDFNEMIGEMTVRLAAIEQCLRDVRAQVFPNSGSSLRDRVDDLYEMVLNS